MCTVLSFTVLPVAVGATSPRALATPLGAGDSMCRNKAPHALGLCCKHGGLPSAQLQPLSRAVVPTVLTCQRQDQRVAWEVL